MINDLIKEYNDDKNNNNTKKEYVDEELNKQLNKELLEIGFKIDTEYEVVNTKIFKGYYFDNISYENGFYRFYKKIPVVLSEKEIKTVFEFRNNKYLKRIDENINFIAKFLKVSIVVDIIVGIIFLIKFL